MKGFSYFRFRIFLLEIDGLFFFPECDCWLRINRGY